MILKQSMTDFDRHAFYAVGNKYRQEILMRTNPLQQELDFMRHFHITSMDEKIADDGKFALFIEDNELPYKEPHVHICVKLKNRKYNGEALRDVYWAQRYKSIISIRLDNPSEMLTYDNVQQDEDDFYQPYNLCTLDDTNATSSSLTYEELKDICKMLNAHTYNLWNKYQTNQKCELREQKAWRKSAPKYRLTEY